MHFGNRTISRSRSLSTPYLVFVTVLIGGILVKYNYAAIRFYNVPLGFGLLVRSGIVVLLGGYLATPLLRARRGRSLLLGVTVVYTAFFLSNFYYNRYFRNYLSYNDILMGQGVRPFRVVARQLFRPADVLSVVDLLVLVYAWYRLRHRDRATGVWPLLRGELRRCLWNPAAVWI